MSDIGMRRRNSVREKWKLASSPKQAVDSLRRGAWLGKAGRIGRKQERHIRLANEDTALVWTSKRGQQKAFQLVQPDGTRVAYISQQHHNRSAASSQPGTPRQSSNGESEAGSPSPAYHRQQQHHEQQQQQQQQVHSSSSCVHDLFSHHFCSISEATRLPFLCTRRRRQYPSANEQCMLTLVQTPSVRNRRKLTLAFPDEVTRERWIVALDVLLSAKYIPRSGSGESHGHENATSSSSELSNIVSSWQETAGIESPGDVYVWGKDVYLTWDNNNQLQWKDAWRPTMLPGSLPLDVDGAAVGQEFGALVDNEADVYLWGRCTRGVSGRGVVAQRSALKEVDVLAGFGANTVSCGASHVVVASQNGKLWTWGSTGESPATIAGSDTAVQSLPKPVPGSAFRDVAVQVSCGGWHTLVLGMSGQVYSWGEGLFGALGHGSNKDQAQPKPVEGMRDVTYVSAGTWHSGAITSSNEVYMWGDGKKGQLGTGKKEAELSPVTVAEPLYGARIKQVACGGAVTAFLTHEGRVYQAGTGHVTNGSSVPFQAKGDLEGVHADEVACGYAHVVAVGIYRRRLFTWGLGAGGRLGHGEERSEQEPKKLIRTLPGRVVVQVTCGPASTAVVLASGRAVAAEANDGAALSGDATAATSTTEAVAEKVGQKWLAAVGMSRRASRMSAGNGELTARSAHASHADIPAFPPVSSTRK